MKVVKSALVSGLILSLLAGCGNNQVTPAATNSTGTDNPVSADSVTINYYNWATGQSIEQIDQIIENFEKENPNINVENVQLVTNGNSLDFYKKLDLMAASGEPIDVTAFSHVDFVSERAARGVLEPLDEYLAKDGINVDDTYFMTPKYQDKVYGLQDTSQLWLVAINKDALDAAGLPVPTWGWTWDDFCDYAKKLTTGSGDSKQYGAFFHTWGEYANFPAYSELPHPYLTKDQTPVFDDESFKSFFELRRAMEKDDQSVKYFSDIIGGKLRYDSEFLGGKAAMIPTANFVVNLIKDTEKFPHTFKTVFAPLPVSSEDVEIGTSNLGGSFASIGKTSKHKEESYKFLKYLTQQMEVIRDLPGLKSSDKNKVIEALVGDNTGLIDVDSLSATLFDERIKTVYDPSYSTSYSSQLKPVLENGLSNYLLDYNLSAEDAQKQMIDEANKIIRKNKE
ncbi:ABC transporter substrate-binding protein [Paenibacillus agaridevorans]|uniref:ABC transporter substrate-binding protein n=1 Tax=Paenibacillus agaridevorans TaxID=171404 RepID=A0A2R5EMM0_9BACL|nr:extracellular solute-binding protein [Paenibacillus agaridevorans]GBG07807.1 ABC transporter substrate-binding protein [Paenibacillus agaridevorans]